MNKSSSQGLAARVSLTYAFFGVLWILFSDQILAMMVGDAARLTQMQTLKGCFYVTVTAILVYALVESGARSAHATLKRRVEERTAELRGYQENLEELVRERTQLLETEIVERKRVQAERERLIDELENRNAQLEQFAYTVSHDLKTPLITVRNYMGALQADLVEDDREAVEDDLQRMAGAADTMARLLDEVLQLSRIGRQCHPPEWVPMDELVKEVLELLRPTIEEQRVQVEVAPDLPTLFGDRQRLLQVLQNLLDNAVKFVRGQEDPRIEVSGRVSDSEVVCCVRDNGIGIEPEYHDRVFRLFDQLDPKADGTGVGLALVKRIIDVHGGRSWVESNGKGHGSRFCFALPDIEGESMDGPSLTRDKSHVEKEPQE